MTDLREPGLADPSAPAGPALTGPALTGPDPTAALTDAGAVRAGWRRVRLPVLLGLGIVVAGVVLALLRGGTTGGFLDPEAARPPGGLALARLLAAREVTVTRVAAPVGGSGTVTFVPLAAEGLVSPADVRRVAFTPDHDVVLIPMDDAGIALAQELVAGLRPVAGTDEDDLDAQCALPVAQVAGRVRNGGVVYRAAQPAARCYSGTLISLDRAGSRVVVLGGGAALTNELLDEEGNAALALGLLGARARVDWVYPRPDELAARGDGQQTLAELLPPRVFLVIAQLVLAFLWLCAWRVRRLGAVVREALPAEVRAAETVEGRAGLYAAARASGPAGESLRVMTRERLAQRLALGRLGDPDGLVVAVAARTGRADEEVRALLYGPPVGDEPALVHLAGALDTLDREVPAT